MASLFKTMNLDRITLDEAVQLLALPRVIGVDPADGVEVTAQNGRYGPYVSKGKESRSLANEDQIFEIGLDAALALLAQPRQFRGRGPAKPPLRELGDDPVSGRPVVAKEGRFGVYVTDGADECLAGQGRSGRGDELGAGVRAAGHPPRDGRRAGSGEEVVGEEGVERDRQEGGEKGGEEVRRRRRSRRGEEVRQPAKKRA